MDCRRTGLRRVETAFAGMVAIGIFEFSQKQRYKEGRWGEIATTQPSDDADKPKVD